MDKRGSGLTYIHDFHSDEMRAFKAGLRTVKE